MWPARSGKRLSWLLALSLTCAACGGTSAPRPRPAHVPAPAPDQSAGQAVDPSHFARGACVAFAPTAAPRNVTVFLDAGHGGIDPGAIGRTESGQTVYEARETLGVELDAMSRLRHDGFAVVVSRTRDTSVIRLRPSDVSDGILTVKGSHRDVAARDTCANDARANVLIGIYFDAGGRHNAGCLTAYDTVRPFRAQNRRLAHLLQADVLAAMNAQGWGIPDAGAKSDDGLGSALNAADLTYGHLILLGPAKRGYFSTPSRMPGALIEPLFITDPFEGGLAASADGQRVIAGGIATAVEQYYASGAAG